MANVTHRPRGAHSVSTNRQDQRHGPLCDYPGNEFQVALINVQGLTPPAGFFQVLLDAFHDAHREFFRDRLAAGRGLVSSVLKSWSRKSNA